MALINCPECNNQVSDTTNSCIHCGYYLRRGQKKEEKNEQKIHDKSIREYDSITKTSQSKFDKMLKDNKRSETWNVVCIISCVFMIISLILLAIYQEIASSYYNNYKLTLTILIILSATLTLMTIFSWRSAKKIRIRTAVNIKALRAERMAQILKLPLTKDYIEQLEEKRQMPNCPSCGASVVSTGQRGFSGVDGMWGSGKTTCRCSRCGCSWYPMDLKV